MLNNSWDVAHVEEKLVIQNSIKYSDNKEVLVTLTSDSTHAFIEVSDQGIGIPDDEIRYVFEPFFRATA